MEKAAVDARQVLPGIASRPARFPRRDDEGAPFCGVAFRGDTQRREPGGSLSEDAATEEEEESPSLLSRGVSEDAAGFSRVASTRTVGVNPAAESRRQRFASWRWFGSTKSPIHPSTYMWEYRRAERVISVDLPLEDGRE